MQPSEWPLSNKIFPPERPILSGLPRDFLRPEYVYNALLSGTGMLVKCIALELHLRENLKCQYASTLPVLRSWIQQDNPSRKSPPTTSPPRKKQLTLCVALGLAALSFVVSDPLLSDLSLLCPKEPLTAPL